MISSPKRLFSDILQAGRQGEASDIHLISGIPPAYRVSGEIVLATNCEPMNGEVLNDIVKAILGPTQLERLEKERELCVSYYHEACGRIRLSVYHRINIPEMSIRLCNLEVKPAKELMLPEALNGVVQLTSGLVIVTGPTGMGKTTTLNYLIDMVNASRRAKIITIEDPVEYEHPHRRSIVTQLEVGTDTASFASCLRHVLRLNPDVIAIGEMRDKDTIETALTAAETGHLVLATLHTPTAAGSVERIVSVFDGDSQAQVVSQLASCLQCVVAQRLIPTVDKSRRVLATEVLMATDAVRAMIRENRIHQLRNAVNGGRSVGMHSLEDSLANLYGSGLITLDMALNHAPDQELFRSLVRR